MPKIVSKSETVMRANLLLVARVGNSLDRQDVQDIYKRWISTGTLNDQDRAVIDALAKYYLKEQES